jgi:ribosomal protein S1
LIFEVREKKNNKYIVSVINAYYKAWVDNINKAIQHEDGIEVHIDKNVEGGFVCHTPIVTLNNLTGKNYTHLVFIPGSHIVLNIEHNFEQWIDKDVIIVPQKFVEFHRNYKTGEVENSLVGSRKRVLQILGMNNLYDMYQKYLLSKNDNVIYTPEVYEGTITGIINSQKNTGVFVELDGKYITGLMHIDASDLLDYRAGNKINVKIKEFEVQEGKEAFITNKRGNILKCNTRPVFELA